eukprot:JP438131.1.p1 GENE.JP438131.1~~JP438131.1.p1  ORF type:complete len:151 (-),score=60.48 JP438131.1:45-461(-)
MASGVGVNDECVSKFGDLKLKHTLRYLTFKLNDALTEIVVCDEAAQDANYDQFLATLPANDCRYAVFDLEYDSEDGGKRNKIVFYVWAPDTAKIKSKMLYASSKDAFRKKLVGISTEIQATDASEVDYNEVLEKVKSH